MDSITNLQINTNLQIYSDVRIRPPKFWQSKNFGGFAYKKTSQTF